MAKWDNKKDIKLLQLVLDEWALQGYSEKSLNKCSWIRISDIFNKKATVPIATAALNNRKKELGRDFKTYYNTSSQSGFGGGENEPVEAHRSSWADYVRAHPEAKNLIKSMLKSMI